MRRREKRKAGRIGRWSATVIACIGVLILSVSASARSPYLEGLWFVAVTLETPAGPVEVYGTSMITQDSFSGGGSGTILCSTPELPLPTPDGILISSAMAQGIWEWLGGDEYLAKEIHLLTDAEGHVVGYLVLRLLIVRTSPDTIEITTQSFFHDLEGNLLFPVGGATAFGWRVDVEALD